MSNYDVRVYVNEVYSVEADTEDEAMQIGLDLILTEGDIIAEVTRVPSEDEAFCHECGETYTASANIHAQFCDGADRDEDDED
jgi:hypothetical protein